MAAASGVTPRTTAVVAAAVLGVGLFAALVVVVPWHPLGRVTPADAVSARVSGDFTDAQVATGDAHAAAIRPPGYFGYFMALLVVLLLGLTPIGAWLVQRLSRAIPGNWLIHTVVATLAVLVLVRVATLPFAAWAFRVNQRAGLATQSTGSWLVDVAKGWGINALLTTVLVVAVVGLARRFPDWWWAVAATGAAVLVVVLSFAYPLVMEPLFNKFTPMPDGALRTSLLQLAERDGVAVNDVLIADASRRTTTLNAYVSGFGHSRRIVIYDNLLTQAPPDEVAVVVAHELGHVKNNDVLKGTLLGALGVAFGVIVLSLVLATPWVIELSGSSGVNDPRVVPLFLALLALGTFVATPVQNLASRQVEARADVHALDLTRNPQTFALMQRRLAVTSQADLTPPRAAFLWFASHPSAPERIAMARTWARLNQVPEPGPLNSLVP